jgi:nitroreductase
MPFKTLKRFGKGNKIEEAEEPEQEINVSEIISSLIKNRRSVRKYLEKDVSNELIEKVLESASYAPSCGNYQPWEFIVVKRQALKNDLAEASYNQKWITEVPVLIVACLNGRLAGAVYGERGLRLYGIQAVAAAIQNMLLTAESLGLGTCWVGAFSELMVARILQCPEYVRPCAIITLGYPAEKPCMPYRQDKKEYIHHEVFGETLQFEEVKEEKKPTYMKFK